MLHVSFGKSSSKVKSFVQVVLTFMSVESSVLVSSAAQLNHVLLLQGTKLGIPQSKV